MDAGTEEVHQGPPGCHVHEHLKETAHESIPGCGLYLWEHHESGPGGVRSEADETQCGYRKPDDGGNVIFFLQPLVEKDDDEQGCHDKTDPGCVKLQQRADQSAGCGADGPVEIVQ